MTRAEHEAIYCKFSKMVQRRAYHVLRDKSQAEEVVQEVFLRFVRYSEKQKIRSAFRVLFRMSTNCAIDRLRRSKRQGVPVPYVDENTPTQQRPDAHDDSLILRRLLAEASAVQAQIATHHFMDGLSQDEIADLMEMSQPAVSRQLDAFIKQSRLKLAHQSTVQGDKAQPASSKVGAAP